MVTPALGTHDLLLSDGTTTIGLMLAKDKNGVPQLTRYCAPSLSPQQFESLSEAAFPPSQQAYVTQDDWCGGYGKQSLSGIGKLSPRYMQTHGVDNSIKGMSYPGPVAVATTNTTASYSTSVAITNGGFESGAWSPWTATAAVSISWTVAAAAARTGSWGARAALTGGSAEAGHIRQQIVAADSSVFTGLVLTITMYARWNTEAPGGCAISLYADSSRATLIATQAVTLTNAFAAYSLAHTFTDGWPQLWLFIDVTDDGGGLASTVDIDDVSISITGSIATGTAPGTIALLPEFNGAHYAVSDTGVWKRTANNWARVAGSPDSIVHAESDGTYLYLARGTSKNYWYMSTGETFYRNTGSSSSAQVERFALIGGAFYGARSPQTVYKFNSAPAATVTTTYTVGQAGYNITGLLNHLESPFITKDNGMFYISSTGTVIEVMPELRSLYNANTGKNAISWNGKAYVPAGSQALMEYDAGDTASIGPNRFNERLYDFTGQVVATTGDDEWLFVVLDNDTKIEVMKGRLEEVEGLGTAWRWHPFLEDTYGTVGYASVSTITAKRLWYGGGTALPKYIPLPTRYGDPLNDTALSFLDGVISETPWFDFGLSLANKTLLSFQLHSIGLVVGVKTIKVEYQLWGEDASTWTEVGGTGQGTFVTSPTQEKFFGSGIVSKKVRFRFTFNTGSPTMGLAITEFNCYAIVNPLRLTMVRAQVRVADDNPLRNGAGALDTEMSYLIVSAQLHAWKDTHPLILTIPDGTAAGTGLVVKFDETYPWEHDFELGSADPPRPFASIFDLQFVGQRVTSIAGPVTAPAYSLPTGRGATHVIALASASSISKEQADAVSDGSNLSALIQQAVNS